MIMVKPSRGLRQTDSARSLSFHSKSPEKGELHKSGGRVSGGNKSLSDRVNVVSVNQSEEPLEEPWTGGAACTWDRDFIRHERDDGAIKNTTMNGGSQRQQQHHQQPVATHQPPQRTGRRPTYTTHELRLGNLVFSQCARLSV